MNASLVAVVLCTYIILSLYVLFNRITVRPATLRGDGRRPGGAGGRLPKTRGHAHADTSVRPAPPGLHPDPRRGRARHAVGADHHGGMRGDRPHGGGGGDHPARSRAAVWRRPGGAGGGGSLRRQTA